MTSVSTNACSARILARRLVTLGPAGLAGTTGCLAGLARLACLLPRTRLASATLRLAGLARLTGLASTTGCLAGLARRLAATCQAGIASPAGIASDVRALFSPMHAAVQASESHNAGLGLYLWSGGGKLDIKIELITGLRASCARVLDHRVLTQTGPSGLKPGDRRLF
jgi:hypothetical protein